MIRRIRPTAAAVLAALVACAGVSSAEDRPPHWRYSGAAGPARWGDMTPGFAACKTGKMQSPIDIKGTTPGDLPPITFAYKAAPLKIVDNGHTIQVNVPPGSSIGVGDKSYELVQFHFHRPSEERINGKAADMDVHLVHRGPDGKLAVVAVLLKKSKAHPLIETLWIHLPADKEKEHAVGGVSIDPSALIPADHGYYTFAGSLTTPPCTEGVTWYVLKSPAEVSAAEVTRFGKLYRRNARPVQPLNDRVIQSTR
jgi:carbonic anhydrase